MKKLFIALLFLGLCFSSQTATLPYHVTALVFRDSALKVGEPVLAAVVIDNPAGANGVIIKFKVDTVGVVAVPAEVKILPGSNTGFFRIEAYPNAVGKQCIIRAYYATSYTDGVVEVVANVPVGDTV